MSCAISYYYVQLVHVLLTTAFEMRKGSWFLDRWVVVTYRGNLSSIVFMNQFNLTLNNLIMKSLSCYNIHNYLEINI